MGANLPPRFAPHRQQLCSETPSLVRSVPPYSRGRRPSRQIPQLARASASIGRSDPSSLDEKMKSDDLKLMSTDELWALHVEIAAVLTRRIYAEKSQLEQRLRKLLANSALNEPAPRERRPYPRVFPKYRNPKEPYETWAGRGKQPRWLAAQLRSGKKLDDFRIQPSSDRKRRLARR
jgi:DNA-binding protein H-NS